MAPERPSPLDSPPSASEEEVSESGSEDSDSESEAEPSQPPTAKPQAVAKPQSSSSPSGETDTDGENVEAIASKPMEEVPVASPAKSGTKRPPSSGGESELKKKAKKNGDGDDDDEEEEESKRLKLFQKIWSDEDEIRILEGMLEYPTKNTSAFHDFIKNSLNMDVSKSQLKDKIWRMRNKFKKNVEKNHDQLTNPHDSNIFELSKQVWGDEFADKPQQTPEANNPMSNQKGSTKTLPSQAHPSKTGEVIGFDEGFKKLGLSETILEQGLQLIGESNYAQLKARWRDVRFAEMELCVRRTELMSYQAKMILEAFRSDHQNGGQG